jgi:hypothetical protein
MSNEQTDKQVPTGAAILWASALLIVAMIIANAARVSPMNAAYADVSEVADLSVLTSNASDGNDIFSVLDRRSERLYVYSIEQARSIQLYQVHDLSTLFLQARGAAGGR